MKAVIDRFEGEYAVLLIEQEEVQIDFPKRMLPENVKEGDILRFNIELDPDETSAQEERVGNLLEKLNRKNKI
ncbi:DUF3006 domain-containing protein [Alkalicella caledoniensis]|uniref:DUF3006 domain-containing protein n=1 Tax=Alkalicella caledoniensis TaxID=2731377 RepID=A0A7G9WAR0_ALKCA|nr:DUF3006 domain-containing protein [Alkalicella caledoniensis]QNO15772.1 DUF3006 domain-containing protein [Alkalicella caledoniensis]